MLATISRFDRTMLVRFCLLELCSSRSSTVRRGELGLTKPSQPRGSFLLLGPTGGGKTETVVVATIHVFGEGKLFRFDMSKFQNQEASGLLLGVRLGEIGYRAA